MNAAPPKFPPALTDRFASATYIASGRQKDVFRAFARSTSSWVAVKILYFDDLQAVVDELTPALRKLEHPNVVRVMSFDRMQIGNRDAVVVSEELLQRTVGNLAPIRHPGIILDCLRGLASGLHCLHDSVNLVHRDLKPDNCGILNGIPKLFDFGTVSSGPRPSVKWGAPYTRSPEVMNDSITVFAKEQDIWALGCTAFYLATGEHPFVAADEVESYAK